MTRLPLPEGPDRETIRAKVQAATLTGAPPATVAYYVCVTASEDGEVCIASNADAPVLSAMLTNLVMQIAGGLLDDPATAAPPRERPEAN